MSRPRAATRRRGWLAAVSVWRQETSLGLFMWVSLVSVTTTAAFLGVAIPLALNRSKVDPAIAAGPFITVLSDIVALLIYMSFATYYLSHFRP